MNTKEVIVSIVSAFLTGLLGSAAISSIIEKQLFNTQIGVELIPYRTDPHKGL
jgi:hypothetical protein